MESDSNHIVNQNESTAAQNSSSQADERQQNDRADAINLFVADLMELFCRGVNMGFLVKRGDNYHWNVDGNCMLSRDSDV